MYEVEISGGIVEECVFIDKLSILYQINKKEVLRVFWELVLFIFVKIKDVKMYIFLKEIILKRELFIQGFFGKCFQRFDCLDSCGLVNIQFGDGFCYYVCDVVFRYVKYKSFEIIEFFCLDFKGKVWELRYGRIRFFVGDSVRS